MKYCSNWVEFIVCLPGQIGYHPNEFNWHLSQWIYSQFDWSNSTGQILNLTGHEIVVRMGVNSLRLHLYACLIKLGIIPVISTQFEGGIKFYPPQSNLTGHEIMVKMGVNSLRLHCMPPWSNWVSSQ